MQDKAWQQLKPGDEAWKKLGKGSFSNENLVKPTRPGSVFCAYAVDFVIANEVNSRRPPSSRKIE